MLHSEKWAYFLCSQRTIWIEIEIALHVATTVAVVDRKAIVTFFWSAALVVYDIDFPKEMLSLTLRSIRIAILKDLQPDAHQIRNSIT